MRSGARVVVLLAVLLLAFQNLSFAQSATTSLRGTVSDAKGLVVAGAEVTLSNAATGFSRSTKTDGQGTYRFLELPPSAYVLTVEAAG
ncbi:MAG: carboxypeptidase-like regulatory domain-containing protein, partial [Candidatus Sulfotelmatobacter sp.]